MSVRERKGRFILELYDPKTKKKQYVATFATLEEAEKEEQRRTRWPIRKCKGCGDRFRPKTANQERCKRNCQPRARRTTETGPHWLYRAYRADGRLLYVGVTSSGMRRLKEHAVARAWWPEVESFRISHYASRGELLAGELVAIRTEYPLYNVKDADLPQRELRPVSLAAYRKRKVAEQIAAEEAV